MLDLRTISQYQASVDRIKLDLESSRFWHDFVGNLREVGDAYLLKTTYPLFPSDPHPVLVTKPFESAIGKSYRKNVLENPNWPDSPRGGWILPGTWLEQLNDVIRTYVVVKYLDGVEYLADRLTTYASGVGAEARVDLEAREEGYYAAHLYVRREYEVPRPNWDTQRIRVDLEVQITTQLQEVIRRLTHGYYERRRSQSGVPVRKWQWDYESDEFVTNYLGHILHYVEGMIMDIRKREARSE